MAMLGDTLAKPKLKILKYLKRLEQNLESKMINKIKKIFKKRDIQKRKMILYFTGDNIKLLNKVKTKLEIEEMINSCKKTNPIVLDMINDKFKIKFVNIDTEKSIAKKFNITSVPNFVLLFDEKEIGRINGLKTRNEIEDFYYFEKYLNLFLIPKKNK
jgi:hypothetical protein